MDLKVAQLAQLLLESGFGNFSEGSVESSITLQAGVMQPMTSIMRSPNDRQVDRVA
jgi:hypothetical protein